ncbi:hypothetical protein ABZ897_01075 [Nonomuraea sp. NPDC046802]|uniref:hypothetical protein n=1 Tax=Nonomuraea sp. NPDC046802 TaxID=3154919 RepID=UPI0033C4C36F
MPRTSRPRRPDPRESRAAANKRKLADAEARSDWHAYYVIASQWAQAEAKHVGHLDPAKASDIYKALAKPLIKAATQLNEQTWSINA